MTIKSRVTNGNNKNQVNPANIYSIKNQQKSNYINHDRK